MADTALLSGDARLLTLKIAAPGVAAMLASSACQLFEALVLAQNDTPLSAAVGACLALILLEQTVGFTLGMGAGSFVSRCIGQSSVRHTSSSARQSHREAAGRAAGAAFFSALLLSGLLLIGGFFLAAPLLRLLGAPESAVSAGVPYARYVLASGPPLCGGLVLGSLLRAQGKTLPNMAAALVGSSLGAALLAALCLRLNLGVHGAGIAMLARETAVFVVLLGYALRHGELIRPSLRRARFTLPVFAEIMRYGLPTLLRQGATSLSAAMLSRVSAEFGAPVLAGMGLCARAVMPFTSAVIGFGQGFQPVCGAAFGAKQTARCQTAYRFCQRVLLVFSLAVGAAVFAFAPALTARFAHDAQTADVAGSALRLQSAVFCAERRHFDDHAHPIAWADRPRRARRHKPTGAFPSSTADASAACFRPLGAACVPERQRRDFACFLVAADAKGLSPFPVHAVFLPSRRGQPSADGGRVTAQIFLVRTVRMFGCSDSVPITST
ncbi:MAG: MATE family efflux transporter [Christensenellales bacterium]